MRIFLILVLLYVLLQYIVSAVNFIKNSNIELDKRFGLIENQHDSAVSNFRFGLKNSGYNGCGWIACRNAMALFGKTVSPQMAVLSLEMLLAPLCLGFFGANPLSLVLYLQLCGFSVKLNFKKRNADSCTADCGIVLYMTSHCHAHYVAYERCDGAFLLHNPYVKLNNFTEYIDSISAKFLLSVEISPKRRD